MIAYSFVTQLYARAARVQKALHHSPSIEPNSPQTVSKLKRAGFIAVTMEPGRRQPCLDGRERRQFGG
jgi:hypothetical protein